MHIEQEDPIVDQLLTEQADPFQARNPDNAKERQIVDVDKLTERGHDDRQAEELPHHVSRISVN